MSSEEIVALFAQGGVLSSALPGFEGRPEQVAMACDVDAAFSDGEIALIEAGTGTGKSMAYLIPALLAAAKLGRRTVISTHTISLQQQLIEREIPTLLSALGLKLRAVLMKGMSHYLCLRRLGDAEAERTLFDSEEGLELDQIREWAEKNERGSLSDLSISPTRRVNERIRMESDSCSGALCPHYKQCLFFRARREAEEANLLVVNHHLLLADLALRAEVGEEGAILPKYDYLVIDEAHHLEEVATSAFAERVSRREVDRIFQRLQGVRRTGRLDLLADKIWQMEGEAKLKLQIQQKIELILSAEKRLLIDQLHLLFDQLSHFFEKERPKADLEESWLRLFPRHLEEEGEWRGVQPQVERVGEGLYRYAQTLRGLSADVESWSSDERVRSLRLDVEALAGRLEKLAQRLIRFAFDPIDSNQVRWMERAGGEILLSAAHLDISERLARGLFFPTAAVVLSSATLAASRHFRFCRTRLGIDSELLEGRVVREKIYDSPFDYQEQAILLVSTDLPDPDHPAFPRSAAERILDALRASSGGTFVLFTSYRMLIECEQLLAPTLEAEGYPLFVQGRGDRHTLLEQFRTTPRAVLFGTSSFWEGVDVAGDALRCVILTKLPFRVPTEPLIQARIDRILAGGGQPFVDYTLPQAIMKFKQGFGRLIRNQRDRGSILCLDGRLVRKPYGKAFLKSLPECRLVQGGRAELSALLKEFYSSDRVTFEAMS